MTIEHIESRTMENERLYKFMRKTHKHDNISLHKELEEDLEEGHYLVTVKIHFYDEWDDYNGEESLTQVAFHHEEHARQYFDNEDFEFMAHHLGNILF